VRVWRIARPVWPPLDGEGARRRGGRWNPPGRAAVYTSERLSLAVLELLVHVGPDTLPADLLSYEIDIPDDLRTDGVDATLLSEDWQDEPSHPATRALGDGWIARGASAALLVPSAVVPGETNVIINPMHMDAGRVTVVRQLPFRFDLRLVREPARRDR
jgi:RES domain-containing protein